MKRTVNGSLSPNKHDLNATTVSVMLMAGQLLPPSIYSPVNPFCCLCLCLCPSLSATKRVSCSRELICSSDYI